uniref:Uncharacterized protein n=1 Tax=Arundo donax TaxID=35708 RepID=A0A0A9AJP8_ARUDO
MVKHLLAREKIRV